VVISGKLIEDQTKTENSEQKSFEKGKITYVFVLHICFSIVSFWFQLRCTETRTSHLVLFSAVYYSALYGMLLVASHNVVFFSANCHIFLNIAYNCMYLCTPIIKCITG
jgi:hypothetical protein